MLKPDCASFHSFDAIYRSTSQSWVNGLIPHIYRQVTPPTRLVWPDVIAKDSDAFYMSSKAYTANWMPITKEPYETFGQPFAMNIFWRNQAR